MAGITTPPAIGGPKRPDAPIAGFGPGFESPDVAGGCGPGTAISRYFFFGISDSISNGTGFGKNPICTSIVPLSLPAPRALAV